MKRRRDNKKYIDKVVSRDQERYVTEDKMIQNICHHMAE
jgi:hypothetical protein